MGTCEICGRRWGTLSHECGRHEASRTHGATACYRIGFEREKARADALARQVERIVVLAAELHDKKWVVLNHHKNGMAAAAAWVDTCRDSTP